MAERTKFDRAWQTYQTTNKCGGAENMQPGMIEFPGSAVFNVDHIAILQLAKKAYQLVCRQ
jgi:hypothetical protein